MEEEIQVIRLAIAIVIGFVGQCANVALAQNASFASAPAITAHALHGAGGWKTDAKAVRPTQRWNLDVARGDDNSIRGRVRVADSPLLSAGNVEGQITGRSVSGTISDDDGHQIATFQATITRTGISGTYTDQTGETGQWSWDGPLPQ